jgi:hypothetical protein
MATGSFQRILFMLRERERRESFINRVGVITDVDGSGKSQQQGGGGGGGGGGNPNGGGGGESQQGKDGGSKATKIRVQIGVDPQGKPVKSPWFFPNAKHGQQTEQTPWKPGQNYSYSVPGGDFRQITGGPYSPNDEHDEPDHAPETGNDAATWQNNKIRRTVDSPDDEQSGGGGGNPGGGGSEKDKDTVHETWIGEKKEKKQSQQGGQGGQGGGNPGAGQQEKKKNEPKLISRMSEKHGITHRIGKGGSAVRNAAHPDGAKTRAGKTYFVAQKDKDAIVKSPQTAYVLGDSTVQVTTPNPRVSRPWIIGSASKDDPVPNDDGYVSGKKRSRQQRKETKTTGPSSGAGKGSSR